jgi:MioC protein
MFDRLKILIATTTGNAEYTAQAIELACADLIAHTELLRMDDLGPEVFDGAETTLFLVCSSTYGSGDVPDNGLRFYARLDDEPRDLSAVRYGVVALGDSSYVNTFANGGRRFDERLAGLGAKRLGEVFVHDAIGPDAPEDAGAAWAVTWLTAALQSA